MNKLPQQLPTDGWNCGFGVIAAIAIISRDVIGCTHSARSQYDMYFQASALDKDSCPGYPWECKVDLPNCFLQPLPLPERFVWTKGDYLSELRMQWFDVIDTLADFQHRILRLATTGPNA